MTPPIPITKRNADIPIAAEPANAAAAPAPVIDAAGLATIASTVTAAVKAGGGSGGNGTLMGVAVAAALGFGAWVTNAVDQAQDAATEAKAAASEARTTAASLKEEIGTIKRNVESLAERGDRTIADVRRANELLEWMSRRLFPDTPIPRSNP